MKETELVNTLERILRTTLGDDIARKVIDSDGNVIPEEN
jgi:hypothetical protein